MTKQKLSELAWQVMLLDYTDGVAAYIAQSDEGALYPFRLASSSPKTIGAKLAHMLNIDEADVSYCGEQSRRKDKAIVLRYMVYADNKISKKVEIEVDKAPF